MEYEVKRGDVFIPDWKGNKDSEEPIRIHYRYLTPEERNRFFYTKPVDLSAAVSERKVEYVQNVEGAARVMITKIENFALRVEGERVEINTAEKLYTTRGIHQDLIAEIEAYLRFATPEVDASPLG